MIEKDILTKNIVLFDGYCNLCNSAVQFILRHEKKSELFFTSLQSEVGIYILNYYNVNLTTINSIILIENGKLYIKSTAALRVTKYMKSLYPLLFSLIVIPLSVRNSVYDYIAKNRYKWFGKTESCIMPDDKFKQRFL